MARRETLLRVLAVRDRNLAFRETGVILFRKTLSAPLSRPSTGLGALRTASNILAIIWYHVCVASNAVSSRLGVPSSSWAAALIILISFAMSIERVEVLIAAVSTTNVWCHT